MKISERVISIAALMISLGSVSFSYLQARSSEKQLLLNAQQLRPHVTYTPTFFPLKRKVQIDMYLQNDSPLPANVMFTDVAASVDEKVFDEHFFSINPDIIHQHRDGVSTLPFFLEKYFTEISNGEAALFVATCAIYPSTAESDQRRWLVESLSQYIVGLSVPRRISIEEHEVPQTLDKCDAKIGLSKIRKAN